MKHFNRIFFILFLLPIFSNAQSNDQPGYIVTLSGDTIRGLIDYKEWDKNPESISFKTSSGSSTNQIFTTKSAVAFAITGLDYYQRFILPISQDQVDINKVTVLPDTSYLVDTVFLHILTKGAHLALFSYTDNIKQRFFITESDLRPTELIYHAYKPGEGSSIQYVTRFRVQLENIAQKYGAITEALNKEILETDYTESGLVKIVQMINGGSSVQFTQVNHSGARWFAGLDVNFSSLKFPLAGGTTSTSSNASNNNSVFPYINGGIDFFPYKNIQRLLIRVELSVGINQFNVSNTNSQTIVPSNSSLNVKQYNASITPQIIYNVYNTKQLKLFVEAGAAINFSAYNHYQYITNYGSSFPESIQNNYPDFDKLWVSFLAGTGVVLNNRIEIRFNYFPSASLTGNDAFPWAKITAFRAGVSYLF